MEWERKIGGPAVSKSWGVGGGVENEGGWTPGTPLSEEKGTPDRAGSALMMVVKDGSMRVANKYDDVKSRGKGSRPLTMCGPSVGI